MKQILIYGDSLSWGIIPQTRMRLDFNERWSGIFEQTLTKLWAPVRVFEDCLNGRRTNLEDPEKQGRNGVTGIQQKIEMHSPLALVVIMLGTNDFQDSHHYLSKDSASGLRELILAIRSAQLEPCYQLPQILIVAPPVIHEPQGSIAQKFLSYQTKDMNNLAQHYSDIAQSEHCHFFDANSVIQVSNLDGVHCNASQHKVLGNCLAQYVVDILS
ncbi:MAG: GDSL family lipase [Moraxellaceae bacterium]|nr:MAG: GDSL family lipase [Moraxellaceae bacterium]